MEDHERKLIVSLSDTNPKLRRLYSEHKVLEDRLARLRHRSYLTSDEELEEKKLKSRKLHGVEQMMAIIQEMPDFDAMALESTHTADFEIVQ